MSRATPAKGKARVKVTSSGKKLATAKLARPRAVALALSPERQRVTRTAHVLRRRRKSFQRLRLIQTAR